MSFLYPLGLLGLIGVPILIIIYIIKNKYTEQVVTSTYLWTLSEQFLKKRLPINKLVGLISLILQIIAVICISVGVAHPVFAIRGAAHDYCFVLDGSGSMNFVQTDKTRLDLAKGEISSIIDQSANGSAYTLVLVGETTNVIYSDVSDKEQALSMLDGIGAANVSLGYAEAIGAVQEIFNNNNSVLTYFVTDKDVQTNENVTVINVSGGEQNYAVADATFTTDENSLFVSGNLISYESDAELEVELYLDDFPAVAASNKIRVKKAELTPFDFEYAQNVFSSFRVVIKNEDALLADNEITVYNVDKENAYSVLLVSENPFYMYAVLNTVGNVSKLTVIDPASYVSGDGYDLCIFVSFTPEALPEHSAVWFVNPTASVAKSGFTVQDVQEEDIAVKMKYTSSTATVVKTLLNDVIKEDVYVKRYAKCGLYRNFTTLLSCGDDPLVFTGTNEYGNRTVVFAFDLKDTNFPPLQDFIVLSGNLLNYAFPTVIDNSSYFCGDTLTVNVVANCDSIRIDSPDGKINYLDTAGAIAEYDLFEVGTYIITVMSGDTARVFNVYAAMPEDERAPSAEGASFVILGEKGNGSRDGIYDNLLILFILLAVFFAADWMVYCYEQYQLR